MDVTPFVENLRRALAASAAAADPGTQAAVENLTTALEAAVRLTLIDVLSAAADEVTRELAPGSVEVRIRNREPEFVVTPPPADVHASTTPMAPPTPPAPPAPPTPPTPPGEEGTARMTLRLPESLKGRVEDAASREGVSVNAWLVRALATALADGSRESRPPVIGKRISGWVR
ncbi:toxin-antitoxin system HicB family antitoxin [Streptosporangium sp. NPDC087985]|uniref:toxin-antitoxin system HicB family antitoxin n=1 Tax=Streptosporangium sp. NPDC087985 TaxID=3366196 RepID=UPI00382D523F